jgi:transposase InsO family protein
MSTLVSSSTWIPSASVVSAVQDTVSPVTGPSSPPAQAGNSSTSRSTDYARVAYGELYRDERGPSAARFLARLVRYYQRLGIKIARVLTDNGKCYQSKRFRRACQRLGIKHSFTRPYRPQTNGKAERFIQTALREWAYVRSYANSYERTKAWLPWLHRYNWHRPHASLDYQPPIRRLGLSLNNLSALHS